MYSQEGTQPPLEKKPIGPGDRLPRTPLVSVIGWSLHSNEPWLTKPADNFSRSKVSEVWKTAKPL